MKKILLLLATSFAFLNASAQADCATPIVLTASGTTTVAAPAGTVEPLCFTQTAADAGQTPVAPFAAEWYSFTPLSNGNVVLTSDLPINVAPMNSIDTRLSVFSGACATLTCEASNDDISASNYRSTLSFSVLAGTTYYFYWDNYWDARGFDFNFTYTPVACLPVATVNATTAITSTSATLNWTAPAVAPAFGYDVEYGLTGFVQGTGTIASTMMTTLPLTGLTAGANYDFYVRAKCTASDLSAWTTANTFALIKTLPYASGLDNNNALAGWTIFGTGNQGLGNNAAAAQSPAGYWIMNTAAAPGPNNNWLFTPKFNVVAGEKVTITFWHRATTDARTLRVTAGTTNTVAAQTIELLATPITVGGTVWTQITVPDYTFTTAGEYVFGFNDNSTATPVAASTMRLDTFNFTSVLSSDSFTLQGVSVYPNPAKDVLNIQSETEVLTKVSITDLNGRTVKTVSNNLSQIALGDLAKGIYMVTIESATAKKVEKLIVE